MTQNLPIATFQDPDGGARTEVYMDKPNNRFVIKAYLPDGSSVSNALPLDATSAVLADAVLGLATLAVTQGEPVDA